MMLVLKVFIQSLQIKKVFVSKVFIIKTILVESLILAVFDINRDNMDTKIALIEWDPVVI